MASDPDLSGLSIMVVEDEFYLASEMQGEIERAGGEVIGPCADLAAGLAALDRDGLNLAVVDINLGQGPSFEMADALRAKGVPFVFMTGYDAISVPARFHDVQRIQKPASASMLLRALARRRPG